MRVTRASSLLLAGSLLVALASGSTTPSRSHLAVPAKRLIKARGGVQAETAPVAPVAPPTTLAPTEIPSGGATTASAPAAPPAPSKAVAPAATPIAGVKTILGGLLVHLTLGTLYCWGNFISYCPKNLRFFDGLNKAGPPDAQLIIPVTIMAMVVGLPISPILQKKFGEQKTMLLGAWVMALGVYLSSYAKTLASFMALYSGLFGFGVGLAYTAPMVAGWKWFPDRKGLVSGSVLTGFGAGGFFFNLIGTNLINPNKINPINGEFPQAVYDRFPTMLRSLAVIYAGLSLVGTLLLSVPSYPVTVSKPGAKGGKDYSIGEALSSLKFWQIWTTVVAVTGGSLGTAGIYKGFGSRFAKLNSDSYQSLVGGLGALANGAGRLFWGSMSDKHGYKNAMLSLTTLQTATFLVYNALTASKLTFALATMSIYFTLGGCFAMFPPLTQQVFGAKNGVTIYAFLYSGFALASMASTLIAKALVQSVGWEQVFRVFALSTIFGFGLTSIFKA